MSNDGGARPPESLWLLRVNPLRRMRLADAELRNLADDLVQHEEVAAALASTCDELLFTQIGASRDQAERRRLVDLRRQVRRGKPVDALPDAPPVLAEWSRAASQAVARRTDVVACFAAALARERHTLGGLLGDDDLCRSLALVAPDVYAAACRYRRALAGGRFEETGAHKSERGLLQYVTRAMTRTSPLARFTAVGIATPALHGVAPDGVHFEGAVSFPDLDRPMLAYLVGGFPPGGDAVGDPWVQLSPSVDLDEAQDRLTFVRSSGIELRRLRVPASPPLRRLVELAGLGPRRASGLAEDLARSRAWSSDQARQAVASAVGAGILCLAVGPEDGALGPDDLLSEFDAGPEGGEGAVGRAAKAVLHGLGCLAAGPPDERPQELAAMRAALVTLSRRAGRPAQVLVEEDFVLPPQQVAPATWRTQLDDLAAAVEMLSVFDQLHDVRWLLARAFVERLGAGAQVPLGEHAAGLLSEVRRRARVIYDAYLNGAAPAAPGPAREAGVRGPLADLHALRASVLKHLHGQITDAVADGADEVTWDCAELRALAGGLPGWFRHGTLSYGVLVQPWRGRLLINEALPGHGMLYGRFLRHDAALGGSAAADLARRLEHQYGFDGYRVLEDAGFHGLNVNAHPPVLKHQITPADWSRLWLAHDPDQDRLEVRDADGRPCRVLTLGAGNPLLFPAPLWVASCLSIGGRLFEDLAASWYARAEHEGTATFASPRLAVGNAVVARRRWYGGTDLTDVAQGPGADADRWLELTRWRSRHGVPAEVFLKGGPTDDAPWWDTRSAEGMAAQRQQQKPQYLDLDSALTARVLSRVFERRGGETYLEEAAPANVDGGNAYEWVVEVSRTGNERFRYGEGGDGY